MPVQSLPLSASAIASALGICETAASRKIAASERFLADVILSNPSALAVSCRPDRVATAAIENLQTIAALSARHPDAVARWIRRLVYADATRTKRQPAAR